MEEETPAFTDLSSETLLSLGDSYYVDENYEEAVEAYAAALALFRETEIALQVRTLSHRSSAFYKLQRYQEAFDDAQNSLVLLSTKKPDGLRPGEGEMCHLRAGLALVEMGQNQIAKEMIQKAAQLASLNNRLTNKETYDKLLAKCNAKLSEPEQKSALSETSTLASAEVAHDVKEMSLEDVQKASFSSKPATAARPKLAGKQGDTPKYQYYQSDKVMTISIMEVGVREEDLTVRFEPKHLVVILRKNGVDYTVVAGHLYSDINVEKSKAVIKAEKVLVKLRKVEHHDWHELLGKGDDASSSTKAKKETPSKEEISEDDAKPPPKEIPTVPKDSNGARPYASHRDWNAIEKDIIEDEKNEKPEGDEAMNKLFKQIYGNASDDTRRAMVKSFQTSGGTVLSTNWDEVKDKDYEKERTGKRNEYSFLDECLGRTSLLQY
jgi:suppressor of G2 allele of SKP1